MHRTSVTLHFILDDDGQVHVTSDDISGLDLSDDDLKRLTANVSSIVMNEVRRRLMASVRRNAGSGAG